MKKNFTKVVNILLFILTLTIFIPFKFTGYLLKLLFGSSTVLNNVVYFISSYEGVKIYIIPVLIFVVSFIYLLISSIEKKKNGESSLEFEEMIYKPILIYSIISSVSGIIVFINNDIDFKIFESDFFYLGTFILKIYNFLFYGYGALIFYGAIVLLSLALLIFGFKNTHKKGFLIKFLLFIAVSIIGVLSSKGITEWLENPVGGILSIFTPNAFTEVIEFKNNNMITSALISLALFIVLFILYRIIISISQRKYYKALANVESTDEVVEPVIALNEDSNENLENTNNTVEQETVAESIIESNIGQSSEEEINETIIETHDLNELFNYKFSFENVTMVKEELYNEYFVNDHKFLIVSKNAKNIQFRFESSKAIKIIIQYPLINKDRIENNKIWFKLDNISIYPKELIINIIKDAYDYVSKE